LTSDITVKQAIQFNCDVQSSLQVGESLLVDGTISVDGAPASSVGGSQPDAGGGSGGTIYIMYGLLAYWLLSTCLLGCHLPE